MQSHSFRPLRMIVLAAFLAAALVAALAATARSDPQASDPQTPYPNNRPPLAAKPFMELPLGSVRAGGWLVEQLRQMKEGMTGRLDSIYPAVMGPRNAWLGGDGDAWERGPYWIDGLLPLAWTLDDEALKQKVRPWIEKVLASQRPDGFFGPSEDRAPEAGLQRGNAHDWWPRMVVLKYLRQYYEATGDERIITFLSAYFRYQLQTLPRCPLDTWTGWARERGGDNLMVVYWLYNITGDADLLRLGDLLVGQTRDWTGLFLDGKTLASDMSVHGVNLAQGFKQPAIRYQETGDSRCLAAIWQAEADLRRAHGWPIGLYGADELLHSGNPTQGSELCTAVEMMFSLENILEITGDVRAVDWLERIAFNALPTQATDRYDARQYYQQLNQVEISRHDRNFVTCYNGTDQLFGPLTGYPCCTANMHQGWPKFTARLWYASAGGGLAALCYAPCTVEAKVAGGETVRIAEQTDYPFRETVRFTVEIPGQKEGSTSFALHLRIPGWCREARILVNDALWDRPAAGSIANVCRAWRTGDCIELVLPMQVAVSRWYERSAVVERGPLVYALKIDERWRRVDDDRRFGARYGDWYYEVFPASAWNYCLLADDLLEEHLAERFIVREKPMSDSPWSASGAPIWIEARGRRMPRWSLYDHSAGPLPFSDQYQAELLSPEPIVLIPYGCTTLRITEFPVTVR